MAASGANAVNDDTYVKLREAWLTHKSIRRAAEAVGVSPSTAAKYISKPVLSDGRPGIKAALAGSTSVLSDKLVKRVETLRSHQQAKLLPDVIALLINEIQSVRLQATGERMADGTIVVDEKTYRRLFDLLREVCEYDTRLSQDRLQTLAKAESMFVSNAVEDEDNDEEPSRYKDSAEPAGQRSKASSILRKFERTNLSGTHADQRTAAQRGLIAAFSDAAFAKKRNADRQAELSRAASGYGAEEEELIAANQ